MKLVLITVKAVKQFCTSSGLEILFAKSAERRKQGNDWKNKVKRKFVLWFDNQLRADPELKVWQIDCRCQQRSRPCRCNHQCGQRPQRRWTVKTREDLVWMSWHPFVRKVHDRGTSIATSWANLRGQHYTGRWWALLMSLFLRRRWMVPLSEALPICIDFFNSYVISKCWATDF